MNNHVEPLFTQFPSVFSDEHSNEEQTGNRFLEMLGLRRSKACIQSASDYGAVPDRTHKKF